MLLNGRLARAKLVNAAAHHLDRLRNDLIRELRSESRRKRNRKSAAALVAKLIFIDRRQTEHDASRDTGGIDDKVQNFARLVDLRRIDSPNRDCVVLGIEARISNSRIGFAKA